MVKPQDGAMIDANQNQRWLEEEPQPKKPRVRKREGGGLSPSKNINWNVLQYIVSCWTDFTAVYIAVYLPMYCVVLKYAFNIVWTTYVCLGILRYI